MNQRKKISTITLFTDAATSPPTGIAIGAFLYLDQQFINQYAEYTMEVLFAKLANIIVYTKYKSKKSTWSEIKTAIDALNFISKNFELGCNIEIYTDCQSLCDLLGRRNEKLKKNNFTNRAGKILPNANLYKELFEVAEKFQIKPFKLKGHSPTADRVTLQEQIFSVLDKCTRKQLRSVLNCEK